MTGRQKAKAPTYTHLAIRIDDYDVRCSAGTNHHLYGSSRYGIDENEPVYSFGTSLTLRGVCTDPNSRADAHYEITLLAESSEPRDHRLKVKNLQERDKDGLPLYRTYRGISHPVYAEPPSLSFVNKVHGEQRWTLWMHATPQMVSDSLLLPAGEKPVYIAVNEKKTGRARHVQSLSIQTTDPAEE